MAEMTAAEASQASAIPVLEIGRAWMMDPTGAEEATELGLKLPMGFWTVGRAGAMGDVSAEVAAGAIGFMAAGAVRTYWDHRPEGLDARTVAERYAGHAARWGRGVFAGLDESSLSRTAELSARITHAALPSIGPLFAAWRTMPVPDDPAGAATIELQILREMRGSAHLAAANSTGLGPHGAIISFAADPVRGGPNGAERFGWSEPHPEPDTDMRDEVERLTTAACVPAFGALSATERAEFVDLVLAMRAVVDI